jgi:hypothetical protein
LEDRPVDGPVVIGRGQLAFNGSRRTHLPSRGPNAMRRSSCGNLTLPMWL